MFLPFVVCVVNSVAERFGGLASDIKSTSGIMSLTVVFQVLGQSTVLNHKIGLRSPNLMTKSLLYKRYKALLACFFVNPHLEPMS